MVLVKHIAGMGAVEDEMNVRQPRTTTARCRF